MTVAVLRKSGGSLILTVPQPFVEQNGLSAGSKVDLEIAGSELKVRPARTRPSLSDLLARTPRGRQRVAGWDEMPPAGRE
jgi:antitoxin component of MazEF toxin-antitoxin module